MPNRPVTLTRKRAVLVLVAMTLAFVVSLVFMDVRIDHAENRIGANTAIAVKASAKASAANAHNQAQDDLRRALVATARESDRKMCERLNIIYERIRATTRVDDEQFRESLRALNIDPLSPQGLALLARAHEQEREIAERFAPEDCGVLVGG